MRFRGERTNADVEENYNLHFEHIRPLALEPFDYAHEALIISEFNFEL